MKTVALARSEVLKWLDKHLSTQVASPTIEAPVLSVALGRPSAAILAENWAQMRDAAIDWHRLTLPHDALVSWGSRRLYRGEQSLPTHLRFSSLEAVAEFGGGGWPDRLQLLRTRWDVLRRAAPMAASPAVLRMVSGWKDVDFDILLDTVDWFRENDAAGLTPRQVLVDGVQGKWLNNRHSLVSTLAGKAELGLLARPTRVHFTYLDPGHRDAGGRVHDSITIGDSVQLPYQPSTVVILENKDTAVFFPPLAQAIAVEGNGDAAPRLLPLLPWIASAASIVYWGDMDSRGYEIVDRLRVAGLAVRTILMDQHAYDWYERFGTNTDENGKPLPCRPRRPCPTLTPAEREVYENLTTPEWTRYRRIEQERISLSVAVGRIQEVERGV